jgi:hypothetical protein
MMMKYVEGMLGQTLNRSVQNFTISFRYSPGHIFNVDVTVFL